MSAVWRTQLMCLASGVACLRRFRSFQVLLHHICIEHAVLLQIVGDGVLG